MNNLDAYALLGRSIGERIRGKSAEEVQNDLEIKKQAALQQAVERAAMDRLMKEIDARAANQRDALKAERELLNARLSSAEYSQLMNQAHEGDLQNKRLQTTVNMNFDDNINRAEYAQLLYELGQRAAAETQVNTAKGAAAASKIAGSKAESDARRRIAEDSLLDLQTEAARNRLLVYLDPKNRALAEAAALRFDVQPGTTTLTPAFVAQGLTQSKDSNGLPITIPASVKPTVAPNSALDKALERKLLLDKQKAARVVSGLLDTPKSAAAELPYTPDIENNPDFNPFLKKQRSNNDLFNVYKQ